MIEATDLRTAYSKDKANRLKTVLSIMQK